VLRVGLTGGLATGKTFVGRELAKLGCHVIQADQLGHHVLDPDGPAFTPVVAEFGSHIVVDGRVDRKALAREVFANPERLSKLNAIIHPLVIEMEERQLAELQVSDPKGIAIIEAAILIETGLYRRYQKLILTVCSPQQQIARAMARGMTEADARARLDHQMPLGEKRKFADYIIDTSGEYEQTVEQTLVVFNSLRGFNQ
jgi:dephospho-CoA kinase